MVLSLLCSSSQLCLPLRSSSSGSSSVALSRTHPRHRPGQRDGLGPVGRGGEGRGGWAPPDAGFVGKRTRRCDEFLHQVRHTQQPVPVTASGPVLRRVRRRKIPGEAGGLIVRRAWSCGGEGDARTSASAVPCAVRRGSEA